MRFNFIDERIDLTEYRLLIPSVSAYLIDRQIIDVMLRDLDGIKRVAYLFDSHIAPCYSIHVDIKPPFNGNTSAAELFIHEESKLAILQLRSFVYGRLKTWIKKFCQFIIKKNFKNIFILSVASNIFFDNLNTSIGAILSKNIQKYVENVIGHIQQRLCFRQLATPSDEPEGYYPHVYKSGMLIELLKNLPSSAICFTIFIESYLHDIERCKINSYIIEIFKIPNEIIDKLQTVTPDETYF
ncbi:hypothetical protein HZS_7555 [Henneguya salminicola]|nr:hypothetical protein HZS_7555 [Henneguya salminicola]